jgi:aspartyl-tRNA(Asn)/glutamyl-tRNA(Gln) amidotransferase subunit C
VLEHVGKLSRLDLEEVEPLAHPLDLVNRLAEDEVGPALDPEQVLMNAPQREGPFFAVPKVLDDGGGA